MTSYCSQKFIGIIIPTITGREKEFERCKKSVQAAIDWYEENYKELSKKLIRHMNFQVISEKDSSREIILRNLGESLKRFDTIIFIDDDDYITVDFFDICLEKQFNEGDIIVQTRTQLMKKYFYTNDGNMPIYGNALFDVEAITEFNPKYVPTWYITGIFFPAKIIYNFTTKMLSKYPIKGCWEDLMYWAYIEREENDPDRFSYHIKNTERTEIGTKYVQVCLSKESLSRSRKAITKQSRDRNIELVRQYLLDTKMNEEDVDFCIDRILKAHERSKGSLYSIDRRAGFSYLSEIVKSRYDWKFSGFQAQDYLLDWEKKELGMKEKEEEEK